MPEYVVARLFLTVAAGYGVDPGGYLYLRGEARTAVCGVWLGAGAARGELSRRTSAPSDGGCVPMSCWVTSRVRVRLYGYAHALTRIILLTIGTGDTVLMLGACVACVVHETFTCPHFRPSYPSVKTKGNKFRITVLGKRKQQREFSATHTAGRDYVVR